MATKADQEYYRSLNSVAVAFNFVVMVFMVITKRGAFTNAYMLTLLLLTLVCNVVFRMMSVSTQLAYLKRVQMRLLYASAAVVLLCYLPAFVAACMSLSGKTVLRHKVINGKDYAVPNTGSY